jgi:hypothetical protein
MPTQIEVEAMAFLIYQWIKEGRKINVFLLVKKEEHELD